GDEESPQCRQRLGRGAPPAHPLRHLPGALRPRLLRPGANRAGRGPVARRGLTLVGRRGGGRAGDGSDGPDDAHAGHLGVVPSSVPPPATVAGGNRRLPALVRHRPGHVSILYSSGHNSLTNESAPPARTSAVSNDRPPRRLGRRTRNWA